jgi:hypothetical protein
MSNCKKLRIIKVSSIKNVNQGGAWAKKKEKETVEKNRLGWDVAQWKSVCLVCVKPWVLLQALKLKKREEKERKEE